MRNLSVSVLALLSAMVLSTSAARADDLPRLKARAAVVSITRDDWGIAHVHGKTDADAVFGMAYAQAEDDFNRVETNFMTSLGRTAEAEGESAIWADLRQKLFIDPVVLKTEKDATKLAYYKADLKRRQELLIRDLGVWAHYVGDASQPLHMSVHYNGWGDYPNPNGYTQSRQIHFQFEGPLAKAVDDEKAIKALVPAYKACDCSIETRVVGYLTTTWKQVEPLYQLEKAGKLNENDPQGRAFTQERIAAGAAALRDLVVDAWTASAKGTIGYRPEISVSDVESGKADPWFDLYGKD